MNINRLMITTTATALLGGLMAPAHASDFCIAVGGGFGNGGTSFVGPDFALPGKGKCAPWAGFTKTADTVIMMTTGAGCLSSDGKVLTVNVASADPVTDAGNIYQDYIQLCPEGSKSCSYAGSDQGNDPWTNGSAVQETCTSKLLNLPSTHD